MIKLWDENDNLEFKMNEVTDMKLTKNIVERFLDQHVAITFTSDFLLDGYIREVYEDSLLFKTKQKESLIAFDAIKIIVPVSRRG